MQRSTQNRIVLVCAPSTGIVDNWLPVLHELVARHPDVAVTAVATKWSTVRRTIPDDTVIAMTDALVDEVRYVDARGRIRRSRRFRTMSWAVAANQAVVCAADRVQRAARRGAGQWVVVLLQRIVLGAYRLLTTRLMRTLFAIADNVTRRNAPASFAPLHDGTMLALYDVYVESAPSRGLLDAVAAVPKFSLHHGVDVITVAGPARTRPDDAGPVTAYLFGERERAGYHHRFGVADTDLRVVGVPRHQRSWIERVVAASAERHEVPWDDAVFLISRPKNHAYLPADRRRQALEDIRDIVLDEFGLRLIIKLHPKETHEGIFEDVFGLDRFGTDWITSRAHPFHIARHSRLAISFFSGVAVDMIVCGVPTIERLDLRGLPDFDHADAPRDERGRPVLQYRQHGLVFGADDRDDLRRHVAAIVDDRDAALGSLRAAYDEVFADPEEATDAIVADAGRILTGY